LGIALRSFGVLWTPQDDNGYLAEQMAKPRQSSMVIAPEQPQPAQQRVNLSGAKDLSGGPPHVQSAERSFALAAATASIHQ
jgi:hypothetical protein